MFVSSRNPNILFGLEEKFVLVFEIIYLFLDFQGIFYGQTTSAINSILF